METLFDLTRYHQTTIGDYSIDCQADEYFDLLEQTKRQREKAQQKRQRDGVHRAKFVEFLSEAWCKAGQILKVAFGKNHVPLIVYFTPSGSKGCRFIKKAEFVDVLFNFLDAIGAMDENWQDKLTFDGDIRVDDGAGFLDDAFYFSLTNTSPIPLSTLATGGSSITLLSGFIPISHLITFWNLTTNPAAIALLPISAIRNLAPAPKPPAPPPPDPPARKTNRKKQPPATTQLSLF